MAAVLLAPHPDDLAFSVGGLLLDGYWGRPRPVTVCSVSAYSRRPALGSVETVSLCRQGEERRFFRRIRGAEAPVFLGWLDAPLRLGCSLEAVAAGDFRPADEEVARLAAEIRRTIPAGAVVVAPLALGGHPDHRLVHQAARFLAAAGEEVCFYEDLPYAADLAPPEIEAAVAACAGALGRELLPTLHSSPSVALARACAVRCYGSQTGPETYGRLLAHPRRLGEGGLAAERLWSPRGRRKGG